MEKWRNRVAVVTGASAGIGAACCRALLEHGMIVVGVARRKELMAEQRDQLIPEHRENFHILPGDLRWEYFVRETFVEIEKSIGPVAVLINNAGVVRDTELLRPDNTRDLRDIVETNVMAVAYCTREAFRMMKASGGDGHVVLINSVAGHKVLNDPNQSTNMYPASKHAITAMTEVYRQEFLMHDTKIRVTSISPGIVDTDIFTQKMREHIKDAPKLRAEDVADAVIYSLQVPPHVQIHEIIIKPVGEKF